MYVCDFGTIGTITACVLVCSSNNWSKRERAYLVDVNGNHVRASVNSFFFSNYICNYIIKHMIKTVSSPCKESRNMSNNNYNERH